MPAAFWLGYLLKLAIVAAILFVLYAAGRTLRRRPLFAPRDRCVNVLETTTLAHGAAVHVIRLGGRYLLLGSTSATIATLAEITEAELHARR